jgi:hypothetical protein
MLPASLKQRFYLHQGHVTLVLTSGLSWMKAAHLKGFTCFGFLPRKASSSAYRSDFNQQAFRQLSEAQLETSNIVMLTNKKCNFVKSAFDVEYVLEALAYTAGSFGGEDCILAKEFMISGTMSRTTMALTKTSSISSLPWVI